jgi:hypothetical protein
VKKSEKKREKVKKRDKKEIKKNKVVFFANFGEKEDRIRT